MVAREALFFIKDGQTIGVGDGSTIKIFLKLLTKKVKKEKMKLKVIPSTEKTRNLCKKLGLKVVRNGKIDLAVDGFDYIDNYFNVSKGQGALAFVEEKKVDYAAKKCILIGDSSKFVKNILDNYIMVKGNVENNLINKKIKVKDDIYKVKVKNKKIDINELEKKLDKIFEGHGIFTRFKELIIIGIKKGEVFIKPRYNFLQVAVDVVDKKRVMNIISKTSEFVDIIEIGTPLVKNTGLGILERMKKYNNILMVDLKIADTGAFEAELAFKKGADIVSVLAGSSDNTILGAIESAKKYHKKVWVDLIDVKNKDRVKRLREILDFKNKPDIICIHTAIDVQKKEGFYNLDVLVKMCKKKNVMVALAGGIDKKMIIKLKKYEFDIYVVGSAITKSKNPRKIAKELKEVIKK